MIQENNFLSSRCRQENSKKSKVDNSTKNIKDLQNNDLTNNSIDLNNNTNNFTQNNNVIQSKNNADNFIHNSNDLSNDAIQSSDVVYESVLNNGVLHQNDTSHSNTNSSPQNDFTIQSVDSINEVTQVKQNLEDIVNKPRITKDHVTPKNNHKKTINSDVFIQSLFDTINLSNSSKISFSELILAFSILSKGSFHERTRWIFRFYDIDNDGIVLLSDINNFLKLVHKTFQISFTPVEFHKDELNIVDFEKICKKGRSTYPFL